MTLIPWHLASFALGLAPLLWVAVHRVTDGKAWGVAAGLAVSLLADVTAWYMLTHGITDAASIVSNTYLLLQVSVLALVLVDWNTATTIAGVLGATAYIALALEGPTGFGLLHRTIACSVVVAMARRWTHPLRWCLYIVFGGGLIAWYAWKPFGYAGWFVFQAVRLLGVLAFVRATYTASARPSSTSWASSAVGPR